jgi:hypothetical protein
VWKRKKEWIMDEKPYQKEIEKHLGFLFDNGFAYEYLYDKGSDSSCVYIYRFRRGRDFLDLRAVSGGKEGAGTLVCFVKGEYVFPAVQYYHKKRLRAFKISHIFKKPTMDERWALAAEILKEETAKGLFGLLAK